MASPKKTKKTARTASKAAKPASKAGKSAAKTAHARGHVVVSAAAKSEPKALQRSPAKGGATQMKSAATARKGWAPSCASGPKRSRK